MRTSFDDLLKVYNTSLRVFEKNITGRMNHILSATEKIKTKNWNEIQMIFRVRNDIDALNIQFKNETIKQMKSISHVTSANFNLPKRNVSDVVLFLTKRTQTWNDKLQNLKKSQIYHFNYMDALDRIEKYLNTNLNITKACDISVSNFVNTNIKYEGDSITTLIKRVIKEEKDSVENISNFTATNKDVMQVITNSDTCNEALRLEIMTALNKLQLEIVDFKNLQARASTPPPQGNTNYRNNHRDSDDDDDDTMNSDDGDTPLIFDDGYIDDVDVDMTTLITPNLTEGDNKLLEEFTELKQTLYTLMDNLKFDTFFSKLDESLKDLQATLQVNLQSKHEEEAILKQLSDDEREEFKNTFTLYFENIERKINDLGRIQQTNINDISNVSSNLLQTKNLLTTTQNTILETIQNENIANGRFQNHLLSNYGEFANFKTSLIQSIERLLSQISEENIGKNNQVITLVNELKGRLQNLENIDTTTNYVTLNMIDDIVKKFNTTNKDELEAFMTTIIGESETYHEKALSQLQEQYNKMFEANKIVIQQQYDALVHQHRLLDEKLNSINLNEDLINSLKDEIKILQDKIILLQNELSISTTTTITNYKNMKEEYELKFNARGQESKELQEVQSKLTLVYDSIKEIEVKQFEIETKMEDKTDEDETTLTILLEELKGLTKLRDEYQAEFKKLNAKIDQFTTYTSLRFNSLELTQRELADKMIELNGLLAEQDKSKKLIDDYKNEQEKIQADLKQVTDELGIKEAKIKEVKLNDTGIDGASIKPRKRIQLNIPSLYKKKGKFTTGTKPKAKAPQRLNHQGRQFFKNNPAFRMKPNSHNETYPEPIYVDEQL